MREENDIVIVFELVGEGEGRGLLEFVLDLADVAWVEGHIHCLVRCADCEVIVVVLDVEAFTVPLLAIALEVTLLRIDKWLHTHAIETVVLHKIKHVKLDHSASLDVCATEVKPLS